MIKVGEATGALEEMLTNVSDFYDEAIEARLQTIINLIEPVILIVMGASSRRSSSPYTFRCSRSSPASGADA